MKKLHYILFLFLIAGSASIKAQTNEDVLNLLIIKNIIKKEDVDSLRAETVIKALDEKENKKTFAINARRIINISGYLQSRFQSFQEAWLELQKCWMLLRHLNRMTSSKFKLVSLRFLYQWKITQLLI